MTPSLLAGFRHAEGTAKASFKAAKHAPGSGIAVEYIDPSVRVQGDFFMHLNGNWLQKIEIPADKASWGTFVKLDDDLRPQLRAIIEDAAKSPHHAPAPTPSASATSTPASWTRRRPTRSA